MFVELNCVGGDGNGLEVSVEQTCGGGKGVQVCRLDSSLPGAAAPLTPAGLLPSDRAGQDSGEEEVATAADSVFGSELWGTTGTCVSVAAVTYAAKGPVGRLLPGRLVVGWLLSRHPGQRAPCQTVCMCDRFLPALVAPVTSRR